MLIRAALGASRMQLLVPPLREGVWLGVASGFLGCGAGWIALRQAAAFKVSLGPLMPVPTLNLSPDVLVIVATLVTALLAGFAVGLGPALRCSADGLSGAINRELAVAEPRKSWFRNALVVIQMAVATIVLIGVGMSVRSLLNLEQASLGFSARNLVFHDVPDIKGLGYDARTGPAFFDRLREHLLATPGIQAVTFVDSVPCSATPRIACWPTVKVRAPTATGQKPHTPSSISTTSRQSECECCRDGRSTRAINPAARKSSSSTRRSPIVTGRDRIPSAADCGLRTETAR